MLNENQVVKAVCKHLEQCGWIIDIHLTTKQRGTEIKGASRSTEPSDRMQGRNQC